MAASAPSEIQVYALLPHAVTLDADLDVHPSNWHRVHCLTIPVETLNALQFSQRPLKWIRYAIGAIFGAQGDLSSSPDSPDAVDYNAVLPAESTALYYHTSEKERRRMFPVDPDVERTSIPTSISPPRNAEFHNGVAERDGSKCVLTGYPQEVCDAVHLVAHSKGDEYIADYTRRRSREPTGGDIIQDIDSVRNGLLLNAFTHRSLGTNVAFLTACTTCAICTYLEPDSANEQTPNFAMTTADIDPTAPPAQKTYTAHLFRPDDPFSLGNDTLPLGSPLRISDSPEWPPPILFDAVYTGATLRDELSVTWKDIYENYRVSAAAQKVKQAQERETRYQAPAVPDAFDMLMTLPYIMVPREELKAVLREQEEKAEATKQRLVREKVDNWMKQSADV
ncbi:hypothetical protein H0H92_013520 [Tricholoma furcatifolium]|nr:hypothetical protein H0H92_013520 [Tricholoma furcatifolium]